MKPAHEALLRVHGQHPIFAGTTLLARLAVQLTRTRLQR